MANPGYGAGSAAYPPGTAPYPGQPPAPGGYGAPGYQQPPQPGYQQPPQPGYQQPPMPGYQQPPQPGYQQPPQPGYQQPGYQQPPQSGYQQPGYQQPPQPGYQQPPQPGYQQPPQPGYQQPPQPGYQQPPQPGYQQPPQPGYQQPPQPGYQQPPQPGYQQPPQPGYQQPQPGYQQPPQGQPGYQQPPQQQSRAAPQRPPAPQADLAAGMAGLALEPEAHGTVHPFSGFNPEDDAAALRKAMKGFGTDEKAIIEVLSNRSAKQRLEIALTFKTMYGKDLVKNLKGELSGHFEDVIVRSLMDNAHFDAYCLRHAMKGVGTDESALIEVICTRNNAQMRDIKAAYTEMYQKDLEKSIASETSGHFKRLLVSCVQANRSEDPHVDQAKAKKEAEELYKAGQARWGTDESKFNQILAMRSYPQLRATFEAYRAVSGYDIVRAVEKEMSGDLKKAFKAVVYCIRNRPEYFADRLHNAMKGVGTDDETLIRVIVARSEIDMVEIKRAFVDKYHKTLAKMIEDDCSGDYKRMLVALVGRG